jgi:hypothetical protein
MVQAAFTPATVKAGGTATLQLTASYAPKVTTALTVTGASGSLSATAPLSLTVTDPPGVKLLSKASFLSLPPGSTASTTITMQGLGGFTDSANLQALIMDPVTGVSPPGITATLSPSTVGPGGTATLTVTAAASAPATTASVAVQAVTASKQVLGGTWIGLNNAKPGFTLFPVSLPASLQTLTGWLDAGLIVNYSGGFTGNIKFTFSGLPAGVIGTFAPMDNCGASTICGVRFELLAGITAVATPLTPVTITATSGNLTASTTFKMGVAPTPSFGVSPPLAGYTDSYQLVTPAGGTAATTLLGYGQVKGFSVSMTGAPPAATTSIVAAPPSGYSVSIATTSQTAPGCYTLNYSGTPTGQQPVPSQWPLYLTVTK